MGIKKHSTSRAGWREAFNEQLRLMAGRFIKRTKTGKRYFVVPVPSRRSLVRWGIAAVALALLIFIAVQLYRYFGPHNYRLSSAETLLSAPSDILAKGLQFDTKQRQYTFSNGAAASTESKQTGASAVSATIPADAGKGVTVTDPVYKASLTMTPTAALTEGKQQQNRIIYPFRSSDGWLVYTATGTGIKEDIILSQPSGDNYETGYTLSLPAGTEARKEADGGIGIYGNELFMNNISTVSDADAKLLEKARASADKNLLLFAIPAPTVKEFGKSRSDVTASFTLDGNRLTVKATGLAKARYPLSIDPSIYIVTAQQFMNGNNETNIDFDVANKLIKKAATTGARFDSWNAASMNLPNSVWAGGTAAAGGYIYTAGGMAFPGQVYTSQGASNYVVPAGVTSLKVKMWGAGGGGSGGANTGATGAAGGGGGYITATVPVTPGETLTAYVGGGGGGGAWDGNGSDAGGGGGGGGHSSLYRGSTPLLIAGGGGGGGGARNATSGASGGAGGGTSGVNGTTIRGGGGGGGGTQTAGGAAGTSSANPGTAGSLYLGGGGADGRSGAGADGSGAAGGLLSGGGGGLPNFNTTRAAGGGGGGGYYGGGGGGGSGNTNGQTGGGGGGGSSYYSSGDGITGVTNTAGAGAIPGNSTDASRNGAGNGGSAGAAISGSGGSGANGLIIISYGSGASTPTAAVSWAKISDSDGTISSANPGSGTCSGWCTTGDYNLPAARTNFAMAAYNGYLYVVGGNDTSGAPQSTIYIAKLGANGEPQLWHPTSTDKSTWNYWYTAAAGLSSARAGLSAVAYNNRLYVMGGRTTGTTVVNTVEVADITPNGLLSSWSTQTTLPTASYGHAAVAYNDRLYFIGGTSSVGGTPSTAVYYNKINSNGTLNGWIQTNSFSNGRISNGGNFAVVWGAYLYVSGGCASLDSNGYCQTVRSDTQVASINADGSLDMWNTVGTVSDTRFGHGLFAWRNNIYEIGGCSQPNGTNGTCTTTLGDIKYGAVNQDGDASTVGQSSAAGTAPCSGAAPTNCNMPSTAVGNLLHASIVANGYLYIFGGCIDYACNPSSVITGVAYTAISSTGQTSKPATCPNGSYQNNIWCVQTTNALPTAVAAASAVIFNNRVYLVGGLSGNSNTNSIMYANLGTDGSIGAWTSQSMTGVGATSVSYQYAYARANPASAASAPGNLYIFGGCTSSNAAGCTAYSQTVYKCNIQATGAIAGCSTSGQLQIGTIPGDTQTGLAIMSGTVYANYIYLIGGVSPNVQDLKTVRYAKIDNNNNIVTAGASGWIESPIQMEVGRRRSAAFGYNGYLYVVGGYEASTGVLPDIEFVKINVSDGSLVSASGTWSKSAVQINQRWGLSVPVSNSYAYVLGGCTTGAAPSSCTVTTNMVQTFQVYNNDSGAPAGYTTSANQYSTQPSRVGASAAVLNGYLYVAGGCTSATDCTAATADVSYAQIDSATGAVGTWTTSSGTQLPAARAWGKLRAAGGSLYYIGGQGSTATDRRTEVYYTTPSGGAITSWSTASNGLPSARTKFGAAVWNDRLYIVGGEGTGTGCTASNVCNTVYASPQLSSGGNITGAWSTASTSFNVARSGPTAVAYANNLYVFGGYDGANYLNDSQFSKLDTARSDGTTPTGNAGSWTYSESLPTPLAFADGFAANGYIYLQGGRSSATTCEPATFVTPVSANTTIASGNNPTGIGTWYQTNQRYSGARYGAASAYYDGRAYVLGGACGSTLTYASPVTQQSALLSQPQVAKYSIMIDTDSDVFPNYWLLNGVDNSVGARWQLKYRSMANQQTSTLCASMSTWGQETNFGNVTLGTPGQYIVIDGGGTDIKCSRYFFFNVTVDSSQAFGYPDDVSRGPTITDLTFQFTADPSKRLMHGRTFTGGLQMPDDTPLY